MSSENIETKKAPGVSRGNEGKGERVEGSEHREKDRAP